MKASKSVPTRYIGRFTFARSDITQCPPALTRRNVLCGAAGLLVGTCCSRHPRIEFTRVPPADKGGPDVMDVIEGRVTGAKPGQRIVVFSHRELWWAEPGLPRSFTKIQPDLSWKTPTHFGTEYAAALVDPGYHPPVTTDTLPGEGGPIVALAQVAGVNSSRKLHHTIQFSGYEWFVRATPSGRGGYSEYDPANAWTDSDGALHLGLTGRPGHWMCSQVILTRSLGFGTYRLTVRDTSNLDPAAVFAMYTLSDAGAAAVNRNPREWDVEISRWGNPSGRNARYVLQPSYLAQNTIWFSAPPGTLIHDVRWESGSVHIKTTRATGIGASNIVAEHLFTSAVPIPGDEKFRINLYDYQRGPQRLEQGAKIVVERFEYLP